MSEMPHPLADFCEHAGVNKACGSCRDRFNQITPDPTPEEIHAEARTLAEEQFASMGVSIQKVLPENITPFYYKATNNLNAKRYAYMEAHHEDYRRQLRGLAPRR